MEFVSCFILFSFEIRAVGEVQNEKNEPKSIEMGNNIEEMKNRIEKLRKTMNFSEIQKRIYGGIHRLKSTGILDDKKKLEIKELEKIIHVLVDPIVESEKTESEKRINTIIIRLEAIKPVLKTDEDELSSRFRRLRNSNQDEDPILSLEERLKVLKRSEADNVILKMSEDQFDIGEYQEYRNSNKTDEQSIRLRTRFERLGIFKNAEKLDPGGVEDELEVRFKKLRNPQKNKKLDDDINKGYQKMIKSSMEVFGSVVEPIFYAQ